MYLLLLLLGRKNAYFRVIASLRFFTRYIHISFFVWMCRRYLHVATLLHEWHIKRSLRNIDNYQDLFFQAEKILRTQPSWVFVSSPIYSHPGGFDVAIKELRSVINNWQLHGENIAFNQISFLNVYLPRLSNHEVESKFDIFYKKIIISSQVSMLHMNGSWKLSSGCLREKEIAEDAGKHIIFDLKKTHE